MGGTDDVQLAGLAKATVARLRHAEPSVYLALVPYGLATAVISVIGAKVLSEMLAVAFPLPEGVLATGIVVLFAFLFIWAGDHLLKSYVESRLRSRGRSRQGAGTL